MKLIAERLVLIVSIIAVTVAVKFTSVKFDEYYTPPKRKLQLEKLEPIRLNIPSFGDKLPIVRLHYAKGSFFCSGVVISSNYVLTAAHCVLNAKGSLTTNNIDVKSSDRAITVTGKAVSANPRMDTALIHGDFKNFKISPVIIDPKIIFGLNTTFVDCGYPMGGDLLCITFNKLGIEDSTYVGKIPLFPGVSGGPLYILEKGSVIGVNSSTKGELAYMGSIINLFDSLGVEVLK